MKKFISFSGGVESTTMCILYGADAKAIWCDTGAEHDEMYRRLEYCEEKLKEIHPNFEIIKVRNEKYKGLEQYATTQKYMPSQMARYCTRLFKSEPISDFLKNIGECELMIGFNADEEERVSEPFKDIKNITYKYPLIEDGLTRLDCEYILQQNNLHPNFPAYMLRGGCRMCFFKTQKEYKALYYLNQQEFDKMVKFEEDMQGDKEKRKKFYSIIQGGKSLSNLKTECQSVFDFNFDELYSDYKNNKTSCGAFCHR